jgi:sialate O-acetylesterase
MHFQVNRVANAEQEIAAADHPRIRLFGVPRRVADQPVAAPEGQWKVCSPETVGNFSAVAYFFGRNLHEHLKVPVGLIQSSLGGTPAEAWTTRSALEADPDYQPIFGRWRQMIAAHDRQLEKKGKKGPPAAKAASKPASRMAASKPTSRPRPTSQASRPSDDPRESPHRPSVLFNGMIHPLIPYAIRGAIWYQGEANAPRAYQYRKLFPAMIHSWRENWGQGDFPFLFVQLANYQVRQKEPYVSDWAELREAQLMALALPRTGMAVTIDIGNPKDVHPTNKQEVGKRLALAARAIAYDEKIPYSGPIYESMAVEGGKIRLRFKHTDGGLVAQGGGTLKGFGIAGQDRKFVDAAAVIDGDAVVVSSDKVGEPVAARYAWADAPECNLFNGAGLPASPVRTDDWPGVTADAK